LNIEVEEDEKESDVGFWRIMKYYNPKWMSGCSILSSIVGSFSFPIFGLIFSEFLFIIMAGPTHLPNYAEKRDEWSMYFLIMCLSMGLVGFL